MADEDDLESVRSRWEEIKERAKRDFSILNNQNQVKVNEAKLKIANYVKGAVSYLRRDLEPTDTTSAIIIEPETADAFDEQATRDYLQRALTILERRTGMVLEKANEEFAKAVDELKAKIARSVREQTACSQAKYTTAKDLNQCPLEAVEVKLNDLKECVQRHFNEANATATRIVQEAKVSIAKSVHDINEGASVKGFENKVQPTGNPLEKLTEITDQTKERFESMHNLAQQKIKQVLEKKLEKNN